MRFFTAFVFSLLLLRAGADDVLKSGAVFPARDTLDCTKEESADAAACLAGLRWEPGAFEVKCAPAEKDRGDWLMRFPSPVPMLCNPGAFRLDATPADR